MKAPPPSPDDCGSTKLSTNCTATAASAALPPPRRISRPASTAAALAAATIEDFAVPSWTDRLAVPRSGAAARSWAGAGWRAKACTAATRAAKRTRRGGLWRVNMSFADLENGDGDVVRLFEGQGNPAVCGLLQLIM